MRKGFTLVELSIVLVIIGLLIGGILVGQSMISSAKINKVVKQLSQYDIVVVNFREKYRQLPGDSTKFPVVVGTTQNDDKKLNGYDTGRFWYHLSLGIGLKNQLGVSYSAFDPYTANLNKSTCPQFDIEQNPLEPCLSVGSYWQVSTTTLANMYLYGSGKPALGLAGVIRPTDSLALDTKIDNGIANTGLVGSYSAGCNTGAAYNISDSSFACMLSILLGAGSGMANGIDPLFN